MVIHTDSPIFVCWVTYNYWARKY